MPSADPNGLRSDMTSESQPSPAATSALPMRTEALTTPARLALRPRVHVTARKSCSTRQFQLRQGLAGVHLLICSRCLQCLVGVRRRADVARASVRIGSAVIAVKNCRVSDVMSDRRLFEYRARLAH